MADRRFDQNTGFTHIPLQPSVDRAEQNETASTSPLQREPVDKVTCRAGDASCATAHASTINRATASHPARAERSLLQLQRQYGNRYVERVLSLAREEVGESNPVAPDVERSIHQERGGGQALDAGVRRQMESAMGADFGGVRVHTGEKANSLNHSLSARAFTTGHDIFFREGAYQPGSSVGRELIAHELTHVVQQNGDGVRREMDGSHPVAVQRQMEVSHPGDPHEVEAEHMARAVMQRETAMPIGVGEHDKDKDEHHHTPMASPCACEGPQRQPEAPKDDEEKKKHHAMMSADRSVVSRDAGDGEQ
jgi:hypothetical protein